MCRIGEFVEAVKNELSINVEQYQDLGKYLNDVFEACRKSKWIPISLYDEKKDLEERIERSLRNYVGADSFDNNGGGYNNGAKINTEEKKHLERYDLRERLKKVEDKIDLLNTRADDLLRDKVKDFIELGTNDKYNDVLKQFYIYRKSYNQMCSDTKYTVKTLISYRRRGIANLVGILEGFYQCN